MEKDAYKAIMGIPDVHLATTTNLTGDASNLFEAGTNRDLKSHHAQMIETQIPLVLAFS